MERQLFAQKLTGIKRRLNEIDAEIERMQLVRGYSMKNLESKKILLLPLQTKRTKII